MMYWGIGLAIAGIGALATPAQAGNILFICDNPPTVSSDKCIGQNSAELIAAKCFTEHPDKELVKSTCTQDTKQRLRDVIAQFKRQNRALAKSQKADAPAKIKENEELIKDVEEEITHHPAPAEAWWICQVYTTLCKAINAVSGPEAADCLKGGGTITGYGPNKEQKLCVSPPKAAPGAPPPAPPAPPGKKPGGAF